MQGTYPQLRRVLVRVTAKQDTDITLQTAKYDGLGRRLEKVVTNSGDHNATWRYYYRGHQIIQANDGSGNLLMQVYHGTRYIDEVVAMRLPHGRAYVHQDANWNVTSLTDLTGAVLERYYYSPYGQVEVVAETYFGDYDGDGFVDAGDADDLCSNGEGCACEFTADVSGDCRVFDFDCDGDLDVSDESTLSALYSGLSADMQNRRIPSTTFSPAGNSFTHQGLVLDVEIRSNQNRMRQYAPKLKRFMQRDPLFTEGSTIAAGYRRNEMSLYRYTAGNPLAKRDPTGLTPTDCSDTMFQEEGDCFGRVACTFCNGLVCTNPGCVTVPPPDAPPGDGWWCPFEGVDPAFGCFWGGVSLTAQCVCTHELVHVDDFEGEGGCGSPTAGSICARALTELKALRAEEICLWGMFSAHCMWGATHDKCDDIAWRRGRVAFWSLRWAPHEGCDRCPVLLP